MDYYHQEGDSVYAEVDGQRFAIWVSVYNLARVGEYFLVYKKSNSSSGLLCLTGPVRVIWGVGVRIVLGLFILNIRCLIQLASAPHLAVGHHGISLPQAAGLIADPSSLIVKPHSDFASV